MSAGADWRGGLDDPDLRVLAAASFPGAGPDALRELVSRYARTLQACAEREGIRLPVGGGLLLGDPSFGCWLAQTCAGSPPALPWSSMPTPADDGPVRDSFRWPDDLVEVPAELCQPLTRDMGTWHRHPPAALRRSLSTAMALLREAWPGAAVEVALLVRALLDGVATPGHQTSGSSAACPFVVAIQFDLDAWSGFLADALVHESSHIRLRLAARVMPMVHDDGVARYRHPWRPDDRPLEAVLVASHAFVAVRRFHARCAQTADGARALAEAERLRPEVGDALAQLHRGWNDLSAAGRLVATRLFQEEERTRRGELES